MEKLLTDWKECHCHLETSGATPPAPPLFAQAVAPSARGPCPAAQGSEGLAGTEGSIGFGSLEAHRWAAHPSPAGVSPFSGPRKQQ